MTIRFTDAAKHYKALSHQIAAWNWLQEQLTPEQLEEFGELYRADPPPKAQLAPGWVAPALKIIKEFEGCKLEAYPDPGTGGAPWTIGYGTTRYLDAPVRKGDKVSQAMAEELLANDVETLFGPGVLQLLPMARGWHAERIAALVSFAYNVGLYALEESTLRKRLIKGEEPCTVVRQELPKWCHAGEAVLAGLERRRQAEADLFCNAGRPAMQQGGALGPLKVPYYSQRDSAIAGQAQRMCFSSSCAMLVATLRPGKLSGTNGDDQYLKTVLQYGDTTDPQAQLKALAHYGIQARFRKDCGWADLTMQIARGAPVPCGFLHHGTSAAPSGGGHWLTVIGTTPSAVIVNDPFGEMMVAEGTYAGTRGAGLAYSRKNWGPRWMVEGDGTGWAIIANP
jgi:GH24 family phage-related lysozyme (muramidase)